MKNIFNMAVLLVFVATTASANSVVNSKHDMIASGFATGGGNTEVCVFCHTPHSAQTSLPQAPLWNNTSVNVTNVYSSGTMNSVTNASMINATDAPLCLSCHDSAVAIPINQPNAGTLTVVNGLSTTAVLGSDMSNDHPIGMNLGANPEALAGGGLRTIAYITGSSGFNENPFYGGAANTMWCSTCHNVHDNVYGPFLRMNNESSNMCKACHIK